MTRRVKALLTPKLNALIINILLLSSSLSLAAEEVIVSFCIDLATNQLKGIIEKSDPHSQEKMFKRLHHSLHDVHEDLKRTIKAENTLIVSQGIQSKIKTFSQLFHNISSSPSKVSDFRTNFYESVNEIESRFNHSPDAHTYLLIPALFSGNAVQVALTQRMIDLSEDHLFEDILNTIESNIEVAEKIDAHWHQRIKAAEKEHRIKCSRHKGGVLGAPQASAPNVIGKFYDAHPNLRLILKQNKEGIAKLKKTLADLENDAIAQTYAHARALIAAPHIDSGDEYYSCVKKLVPQLIEWRPQANNHEWYYTINKAGKIAHDVSIEKFGHVDLPDQDRHAGAHVACHVARVFDLHVNKNWSYRRGVLYAVNHLFGWLPQHVWEDALQNGCTRSAQACKPLLIETN